MWFFCCCWFCFSRPFLPGIGYKSKLTSTWVPQINLNTWWWWAIECECVWESKRCENEANKAVEKKRIYMHTVLNRVNIARILSIQNVILSPQRQIQFTYFAYRPHCSTMFTCQLKNISIEFFNIIFFSLSLSVMFGLDACTNVVE